MDATFLKTLTISTIFIGLCSCNFNLTYLQEKYPGYGEEFLFFTDDMGEIQKGYLKMPKGKQILNITPDYDQAIIYNLYTKDDQNGVRFTLYNESLEESKYDVNKKTKVIIHGWLSSSKADSLQEVKDMYLKNYDYNVITVDWSSLSKNPIYPIPATQTVDVGKHIGTFLNLLISYGSKPRNMHIIGHSLGAHIAGFAADEIYGQKLGRITGLDPALPGFDFMPIASGKLDKTDADFVDVIHTCAGLAGVFNPVGHADFYPNGGGPAQPGCETVAEIAAGCSHGRSIRYFAESISDKNAFQAHPCPGLEMKFSYSTCLGEPTLMGEHVPRSARGIFYVQTRAQSPFSTSFDNKMIH